MKAILIDPFIRVIKEVEHDGSLEDIYDKIKCDCFDLVHIDDQGDAIYVDDEGLLGDLAQQVFFKIDGMPLAGRGLVLGSDDEGCSTAPTIDISDLTARIEWTTLSELYFEGM